MHSHCYVLLLLQISVIEGIFKLQEAGASTVVSNMRQSLIESLT